MKRIVASKKNNVKDIFFIYIAVSVITFILLFIGYMPVSYSLNMNVDIDVKKENGRIRTYNKNNSALNIYYYGEWNFGEDLDDITLASGNYSYDLDKLIFSTFDGVKRIVFHDVAVDVWGIETVNTSGVALGQHTFLNGGITPSLEGDDFILTIDNPDAESMFMITGYDFIPFWFWIIYGVLFLTINVISTIVVYFILQKFSKWKGSLFSISLITTTLLMGISINSALSYLTYDYFFLNWIIVFIICNIINCLTVHYIGTIVGTGILLFWYIANYYVILFRSKPIMPSDFYAIGTAGEVIGGYNIIPTAKMIICIAVWLAMCAGLIIISKKENKTVSVKSRAIGILGSVAVFVLCLNNPIYNSLNTFVWNAKLLDDFYSEGMVLSFTRSYFSSFVNEPDNYSKDEVNKYLEKYKSKENTTTESEKPTKVIMIMNEAYSDLRDSGMNQTISVQPFIDSMSSNTLSGNLFVSVYGGGTCNTEFESLTGNSMALLPSGSYPYSQYVKNEMFSLATYFKKLNYSTNALHPGAKDSWNRNLVYPRFSFDSFYSREDYENVEYLHLLPSDDSNYRFIESIDKEADDKEFYFNVTYQNHSGYESWEDVPKNENAMQIPTTDAQIYLSLIAESDKAVEKLIDYYKDSQEKTMIIFFGDHQPGLSTDNDYYIYNNNVEGLNKYKTELFIWTNYESEQTENVMISANYLPLLVLERGGFELPPYLKMLKDVYDKYPIITSQGIVDNNGNFYAGINDIKDDPLIKMYQYVQYANMFDDIDEAWFTIDK